MYHKLTYTQKFKRTLYAGLPILIFLTLFIFLTVTSPLEKILVPLLLLIMFLAQLLYTYKKSQSEHQKWD